MGSHMKQAIFEEQTAKALNKWQTGTKERGKSMKTGAENSNAGIMNGETTVSRGS